LRVQTRIQMHPWMLVETTRVTEFECYFACTRKGVHLYFVTGPAGAVIQSLDQLPWQRFALTDCSDSCRRHSSAANVQWCSDLSRPPRGL